MKRLYLQTFLAALLLTVSTNANAAVASMADLFGKYKFTATVEVTADGEAYKEHFAAESEVVITKDAANIYDAQITGFAGAKGNEAMKVNKFSAEKNAFAVSNPNGNNYGVFTGGIYYSETASIRLARHRSELLSSPTTPTQRTLPFLTSPLSVTVTGQQAHARYWQSSPM